MAVPILLLTYKLGSRSLKGQRCKLFNTLGCKYQSVKVVYWMSSVYSKNKRICLLLGNTCHTLFPYVHFTGIQQTIYPRVHFICIKHIHLFSVLFWLHYKLPYLVCWYQLILIAVLKKNWLKYFILII